jgi:hypothetical protein
LLVIGTSPSRSVFGHSRAVSQCPLEQFRLAEPVANG